MSIREIILAYSAGEYSVVEANEKLKALNAGFHLDPNKNHLTIDEIEEGTAGLVDSGTETLDKVMIDHVNLTIKNGDYGNMVAQCYYQGRIYTVKGNQLKITE